MPHTPTALLLLCGLVLVGSACAQSVPAWPTAFNVTFDATVLPWCPGFSCQVAEYGTYGMDATMYYDYSVQSERLDMSGCAANGTPGPCSFIFNATGGFLLQDDECCQAASVGTVIPSWTSVLRYVNDYQQAYNTPVQVFAGGKPTHSYFYNNVTQSPVMLLVHDINELWHFHEPFQVGPQKASLFDVPDDCPPCGADFSKAPGLAFHRLE